MNKRKLLISIAILAIIIIAGIAYWNQSKTNKAEVAEAKQFQEQMKKVNPEIYNKLVKTADEARSKTEKDKKDFQAWLDLGVSSQNLGNKSEAETAYKEAIRINRNSFVAWNNLASLYRDRKEYNSARDSYLEIIKFSPSETSAYINLAEMYAAGQAGTVAEARTLLEQGLKVNPSPALKATLENLPAQ